MELFFSVWSGLRFENERRVSMKRLVTILLLMFVALPVTPGFAAGDVAEGRGLFGKKCASCHGASGEGKESVAKTFKVEIRDLASKELQTKGDADLKKIIIEGTGKMKGLKDVNAKSADDIIAYMRTF